MVSELDVPKHKNILIVTENFTFGGLETHLQGKIKHLKNCGHEIFLVTGPSFLDQNLPYSICKKVYTGFNLSGSITSQEAVEVSYKLAEIIRENEINVVDAHPFFSALPAFFSALITTTPFIYTLHGPASVMEEFGAFTEWFTKCIMFESASLVNNVSRETYALTKNFVPLDRNFIFNNAVDVDVFSPEFNSDNKVEGCCIVSRLDSAKVKGIKEFLTLATYTNISVVDIYGDGPEYNNLVEWISFNINKDTLLVQLKGICFDMASIYRNYSIVAGMGRVALEAASLNKPVILVGYDGVKGILDQDLTERASFYNLSGRGLKNIDKALLIQQLERLRLDDTPYRLAQWIRDNANEKTNWKVFSKQIDQIGCHLSELVHDVFQCFQNHTSTVPYAFDEVLAGNIKNVLRSARHIGSNAYAFMRDLELTRSQNSLIARQQQFEDSLKLHIDQSLTLVLKERAEDYRNFCAEKEEVIRSKQSEINELTKQLQDKNLALQASLQAAQEADRGNSEKELRILELEAQLALSVQAATVAEKSLAEREQRVKALECQIIESERSLHDVKLVEKGLLYKQKCLELDLNWYRATFEDRCLFGIIKDKTLKVAHKK
ncbi:hypothetical protein GCM10027443_01230 [Pontibacter brevis]